MKIISRVVGRVLSPRFAVFSSSACGELYLPLRVVAGVWTEYGSHHRSLFGNELLGDFLIDVLISQKVT